MKEINSGKYQALAVRYTKALFEIAEETGKTEKFGEELKNILNVFEENQDIQGFFTNPIIKIQDKKEVLEKSFNGKIDEKLYDFLSILLDKNRIFILPNVQNLYEKEIAKKRNILPAEVVTAIELDEDMTKLLKEKLQKITGKNITVINNTDKEIIGGAVLKINGKVIDGSIKTQLKSLQKQLI